MAVFMIKCVANHCPPNISLQRERNVEEGEAKISLASSITAELKAKSAEIAWLREQRKDDENSYIAQLQNRISELEVECSKCRGDVRYCAYIRTQEA